VTLDGLAVGVNISSGMDTIFRRRSVLARPSPGRVQQLVEDDRRAHE
jgi:hypothetical protein